MITIEQNLVSRMKNLTKTEINYLIELLKFDISENNLIAEDIKIAEAIKNKLEKRNNAKF